MTMTRIVNTASEMASLINLLNNAPIISNTSTPTAICAQTGKFAKKKNISAKRNGIEFKKCIMQKKKNAI